MITLNHYLILAALLFCIGLYGAVAKRNAIAVLMGIELMLNAGNINLVAFGRFLHPEMLTGHIFAIFVMTIAAAEAAVGLAIVISVYRNIEHISVDKINFMRW
jgi:NADH:ubiquinone oxidoreductase subunit K